MSRYKARAAEAARGNYWFIFFRFSKLVISKEPNSFSTTNDSFFYDNYGSRIVLSDQKRRKIIGSSKNILSLLSLILNKTAPKKHSKITDSSVFSLTLLPLVLRYKDYSFCDISKCFNIARPDNAAILFALIPRNDGIRLLCTR